MLGLPPTGEDMLNKPSNTGRSHPVVASLRLGVTVISWFVRRAQNIDDVIVTGNKNTPQHTTIVLHQAPTLLLSKTLHFTMTQCSAYFLLLSLFYLGLATAWSANDGQLSSRRSFVETGISGSVFGCFVWTNRLQNADAAADKESFDGLVSQIQQARKQLERVPALIDSEKWDAVRAILIEPPLADCWAKTNRPLLTKYAEGLNDAGGDELAALEAREELVSHLRYLDMAVYNNVFNPIKVEGKSGATKELIRSYYEDPMNEFKASASALEELIKLSKDS